MLRRIVQCASLVAVVGGLGVIGAGCLDRPVVTAQPQTKTNFSTAVAQNSVDQLDILFDIDNSASMGDKQNLLELAIPDLISRLVTPNCLDNTTNASDGPSTPNAMGIPACPAGQTLEFPPVHDMHLGIVSSSLGSRGGDICFANQMVGPFADGTAAQPSHTDDQGHLLGRSSPSTLTGGAFPANAETFVQSPAVGATTGAGPQNFIDWFPPSSDTNDPTATVGTPVLSPATVLTIAGPASTPGSLEADFANLVAGVQAFGCGIESQLESWYRFLIQPDPYQFIAPYVTASGAALPANSPPPGSWVGVDQTIIQQRHDFLRPKSLVAIIVLTDENDSEIDTRSFGGGGYNFMISGSPASSADGSTLLTAWNPPKGTSVCAANPASPQCTSCYANTAATKADPNCAAATETYTSPVDWGNDANLRHVHMKQKYGISTQYPVQRYYIGLTSPKVPDRTMEYPPLAGSYQGGTAQQNSQGVFVPGDPSQLNCTNPLFAPALKDGSTSLPDGSDLSPATLCNTANPATQLSSRGTGLVFFAHIGGVPHELLQAQPGVADDTLAKTIACPAGTAQADCPQKDTLAPADWVKILGNGDSLATPTSGPSYDYSGIDPHMVESYQPRVAGATFGGAAVLPAANPTAAPALPAVAPLVASAPQPLGGGTDPINGREWKTDDFTTATMQGVTTIAAVHKNLPVDREYACIFPLVDPPTGTPTPRDCSDPNDTVNQEACDCSTPSLSTTAIPSSIPAVCGQCPGTEPAPNNCSKGGTDYNLQYFAKAYPTIREIELVHLMGDQGILSSLCPIHPAYVPVGNTTDPVFGYRPAVNSIINRLKTALTTACIPQPLAPAPTPAGGGQPGCATKDECVQCLILATLSPSGSQMCSSYGFSDPTPQVKANFLEQQGDSGATGTICVVPQIPYQKGVSCKTESTTGWCYVDGAASGSGCVAANTPQSIVFSGNTLPGGSVVSLQCLEASGDGG
jgi:hypothetical protein